jgi:hypothetical protein
VTGLISALLFLLAVSCTFDDGGGAQLANSSAGEGKAGLLEVSIGAELADCEGVGPRKCMVVYGQFFYETIEGFRHEPGFRYRGEWNDMTLGPGWPNRPRTPPGMATVSSRS